MRPPWKQACVVVASLIGACGGGSPGHVGSTGGAVATGGASATAGAGSGGSGTGGLAGGGSATGGNADGGRGGGRATGGNADGGRGGAAATGGGGTSSPSTGGAGGASSGGCTRETLKSALDGFFRALAAHDAALLSTGASLKATENGKVIKPGTDGLWKGAGAVKYAQSALDTELCMSGTHAVVPENGKDLPVAVRLRVQDGKVTEIETIVVRDGDYKVSGSTFASNTDAIIKANDTVKWETPVPADMRATRAELTGWIDKYFRQFPRGVCNTVPDCKRLENGGGNFACASGAGCDATSSSANAMTPMHVLADVETGIGVGMTIFQKADIDMHMFKMYGGKVYAVHAILGAGTSSGWE